MDKKFNIHLCSFLSILLIISTFLPKVAEATTFTNLKVNEFSTYETIETNSYLSKEVDDFLEESGVNNIDFNQMSELEIEEFFEEIISNSNYIELESDINVYISSLDGSEQIGEISVRALPVAFAAIGVIALRIAVTQGTKAATTYLKKSVKKYNDTYKITFPGSKQLILIQDKKTNKRLFSLDNHSVKLIHKSTGKGYPKAFSAWHFHKAPDMSQHYLMCSSIPKDYKVQKGKCYF